MARSPVEVVSMIEGIDMVSLPVMVKAVYPPGVHWANE
jgi:hypothetical protein